MWSSTLIRLAPILAKQSAHWLPSQSVTLTPLAIASFIVRCAGVQRKAGGSRPCSSTSQNIALQIVACFPLALAICLLHDSASTTSPLRSVTMVSTLGAARIACHAACRSARPTVCTGPGSPPYIALTGTPCPLSMTTAHPHLLCSGVSEAKQIHRCTAPQPTGCAGCPSGGCRCSLEGG